MRRLAIAGALGLALVVSSAAMLLAYGVRGPQGSPHVSAGGFVQTFEGGPQVVAWQVDARDAAELVLRLTLPDGPYTEAAWLVQAFGGDGPRVWMAFVDRAVQPVVVVGAGPFVVDDRPARDTSGLETASAEFKLVLSGNERGSAVLGVALFRPVSGELRLEIEGGDAQARPVRVLEAPRLYELTDFAGGATLAGHYGPTIVSGGRTEPVGPGWWSGAGLLVQAEGTARFCLAGDQPSCYEESDWSASSIRSCVATAFRGPAAFELDVLSRQGVLLLFFVVPWVVDLREHPSTPLECRTS